MSYKGPAHFEERMKVREKCYRDQEERNKNKPKKSRKRHTRTSYDDVYKYIK